MDACALIAFLADEEGADKVERILDDAKRGACKIFMNKINLLEVYYGIYREEGIEKAEEVLKSIQDLPLKIVSSLKSKIFKKAGRLKATYKISLADSIALAEASAKKARLITADHHEFDEVEKKEEINFCWIR
jgi:predicted nucleic acid-binding protein